MKKFFTLLFTVAVAFSLTMPVLAKSPGKKKKEATTASEQHGKAHKKHGKKRGATEGQKEGQEGTNPGGTSRQ